MARLRLIALAVAALALAGFAVARFKRTRPSPAVDAGLGSVCRQRVGEERTGCYQRVLTGHLDKYGVADAVATLDSFAAHDPDLRGHLHEYAHGIGKLAYGRYPDVVATFVACGDGAESGCRHGFMQAYLQNQPHITPAAVAGFCRPFEGQQFSHWLLSQCLHGLGHGLTMFYEHDTPHALKDCEWLQTEWQRQSCYGGAFMESYINATATHHHGPAAAFKAVDPTDLLYPCSVMARRYLYACYEMQTTIMLHLNGGDFSGAARECDRAPQAMRVPCYESLGRDATSYGSQDPDSTAELCAKASPASRGTCYGSAARSLVNIDGHLDRSLALCHNAAASDDSVAAARCYWYLGNTVAMLLATAGERDAACARAPAGAALAACRDGAGL